MIKRLCFSFISLLICNSLIMKENIFRCTNNTIYIYNYKLYKKTKTC